MTKFIIFTEGLKLEKDYSFTFSNGFKLCNFNEIEDNKTSILLESFLGETNYYILYKEIPTENITPNLIEEARDILDIISIHLNTRYLYISAATNYTTSNIPDRIGIRTYIDSHILKKANEQLIRFSKFNSKEKSKLRVSLRFLNKSKNIVKMDSSIEHAIFIRIAMENIFGTPYNKIRNTISERAPILLNEFNETELISGFKKFYDQTSKAIHTGIISTNKIKSKNKKVVINGKTMYDLLALSVGRIIDNGFPNWENQKLS